MSPERKRGAGLLGLALMAAFILIVTQSRSLAESLSRQAPAATMRQAAPTRETVPLTYDSPEITDRRTLPVHLEPALPPMYQVTDGPPGEPAAKRCEGCSEWLDPATNGGADGPLAPLSSVDGALSGWQTLESTGFEEAWPWPGQCQLLYDGSDDGLDRTWGRSDQRPHSGDWSLWPAAGGEDGIDPRPPVSYTADLDSWLICGPFDLSQASSAYAAFWLWSEVEEGHDEFFFGVGDGSDDWFYGYAWDVSVTSWTEYRIYFPTFTGNPAHDSTWLAWNFESDTSNPAAYEGSWLDDIQIARALPCPIVDPGNKGLYVHPNELPAQVETIADAGTGWVRLELHRDPDGRPDLDRYAGIVDSLCENGMAAIGLVDYTTIPEDLDDDGQPDYDDPKDYVEYQRRFTETVEGLAHHFRGSIRHWEIWNEENGELWHIRPEYYARLLVSTSEILKAIDADNKVLFGGLDHVWVTSQYLEPIYYELDGTWGGARPFDILAVHPYFTWDNDHFVLDPRAYLRDDGDPPDTILDPYLDFLASRGDGDKDIWITEIGWNSALENPAIGNCPGMQSWCVDRVTQTQYLQDSFDILFNEVEDPLGRQDRVKTIVWYQYQDTAWSAIEMARRMSLDSALLSADPDAICPADWGLVDGNRKPKQAYWAYQAYPQRAAGWMLASFTASPQQEAILVTWQTYTETTLLGFNLYQAESPAGPRTQLNESPIPAGLLGPLHNAAYEFLDEGVTGGSTYFYFLEGVCAEGPTTIYGPVRATAEEEPPPPVLQAINDSPTPLGLPTMLTATLHMTITTSTDLTYTWAFGDSAEGQGATLTHTYPLAGVYTAVVTASDTVSERLATTVVTVDEVISGLSALNDSPTPLGETTTLTASVSAGSNLTYTWAFGDGWLGAGRIVTHTYSETQVYSAAVTATNSVSQLTATTSVDIKPAVRWFRYLPLILRQLSAAPRGSALGPDISQSRR